MSINISGYARVQHDRFQSAGSGWCHIWRMVAEGTGEKKAGAYAVIKAKEPQGAVSPQVLPAHRLSINHSIIEMEHSPCPVESGRGFFVL